MLSLKIFSHYLFSSRSGAVVRTIAWICIAGVAVGVSALIIVIGVMNGFNAGAYERFLRLEPHLVVKLRVGESLSEVAAQVRSDLQGFPVAEVAEVEQHDLIVRTLDGLFSGAVAKGVSPENLSAYWQRLAAADRAVREPWNKTVNSLAPESGLEPGEVAMGSGLAMSLRANEGDPIEVLLPEAMILPPEEAPPVLRMVFRRDVATALEDLDNTLLVYRRDGPLKRFVDSPSREQMVEVRLKNGLEFAAPARRLKEKGYFVDTWVDRNAAIFFALKMEKTAMTVFLSLSAIITSFSILTVLVLLVNQKRKDIGMLMTMGLTPRQARRIFAEVGVLMSSLGVGLGLGIGTVVCYLIDRYPLTILPDIYQDRTIPAEVRLPMVLAVIVAGLVIALLGAWFPAYMAAKGSPAEALRGSLRDV